METIEQFVGSGISTIDELKAALQLAMQLEFATIPPYLCAQWSIKSDPSRVEIVIHSIVSQEMEHLALVGNLLTAIGGTPAVSTSKFIPHYPLGELPGGIKLSRRLHLRGLTRDQVERFMEVEHPQFPPVAFLEMNAATIGEFYDTIIEGFKTVNPTMDSAANRISVDFAPELAQIADAIATIERVKIEGEGLKDSPEQPVYDRSVYAHYYLFKEVFVGRRLVHDSSGWSFTGEPVAFPEAHQLNSRRSRSKEQAQFRAVLRTLLEGIEACWTKGDAFNVATMFELGIVGRALARNQIVPDFSF